MSSIHKRKAKHKVLWVVTLLLMLLYTGAVCGYYIPASVFWPGAILSLGFVYAWFSLWALSIVWFKKNKVMAILPVLFALAGTGPIAVSFSTGFSNPFPVQKDPQDIRVMQWNCMGMRGNNLWWAPVKESRKQAEIFIKAYQPDIICIQDFMDFKGKIFFSNEAFLRDTLGYRYSVFALHNYNIEPYGVVKQGLLILSKIPIIRQSIYYYENQYIPESILWAEVMWKGKPLRIVTTHFSSIYLRGSSVFKHNQPNYLANQKDIILSNNPITKLRYYQKEHFLQALQLKKIVDTSSVPVILAADLNTVPANHTYKIAKGKLTDGFRGSSTGMGATYNYLLPNIRIDYLMHDKQLKLNHFNHFEKGFYDHDHLLGDYQWPNDSANNP